MPQPERWPSAGAFLLLSSFLILSFFWALSDDGASFFKKKNRLFSGLDFDIHFDRLCDDLRHAALFVLEFFFVELGFEANPKVGLDSGVERYLHGVTSLVSISIVPRSPQVRLRSFSAASCASLYVG